MPTQDQSDAAHARFMRRRANFVESNPNAVSPWERKAVLGATGRDEAGRLREHEMEMLKERNAGELAKEAEHTRGLRGQGVEAAEARANADMWISNDKLALGLKENETKLSVEEKRLASQQKIAEGQNAANIAIQRSHDETALSAEEKRAAGALAVEKAKGRTSVNVARLQTNSAKRIANTNAKEAAAARADAAAARSYEAQKKSYDDAVLKFISQGITPERARDMAAKARGWRPDE